METYNGHVRTPADAIILFEACRLGLLPRVQRRLSEKERQSIRSGSVFVWDEREAGMRRWTDGKSWSASRVSGSFLTYREMEGKRGGSGFAPPTARAGKTPDSGRTSGDDREMEGEEGPDGYRYKPDGLMKQSFSITTSAGQHLHLISYYARSHPTAPGLQQPSTDPTLRSIRPQKGMYPESTINDQSNVPAVTRSPMMGAPGYAIPAHTASYHRPGATHPQGYVQAGYAHPAYGFVPSPLPHPSNGFPMPQYGPGPGPGPAPGPGPNGLPHHSGNGHPGAVHYGQQPPPPVAQSPHSALDHRQMRNAESSLPPPPPLPQYSSAPSPRSASAYMQDQSLHLGRSPTVPNRSPLHQPPPAIQIDPRLMTPAIPSVSQSNGAPVHNPPPNSSIQESFNDHQSRDNGLPPATASHAPSIGALVHGSMTTDADISVKVEQNSDGQGSASPGGTKKSDGPQDIPSEKLAFREDKRALRQLDKVFTA